MPSFCQCIVQWHPCLYLFGFYTLYLCSCLDFVPFYISLIETPFAPFYIFTHIKTPLGSIWLEKWESGRIENWEGIENWEDRRNLVFSYFCLVGRVEKWREGKLIYLVKKKNVRIEKWSWYKFIIMSLLNKTKKQHIFFSENIVYVQTKMSHNFLVKIIVRASGQKKKKKDKEKK